MTDAPEPPPAGTTTRSNFEAFVAELESAVREERRSTVHERVRHALISELYGAGLVPTVDSPIADVICDGPTGMTLYEVLGADGTTYQRMREAVLRILEVQHVAGEPAERRYLVLPGPPAEPWAPDILAEAFETSVIWRADGQWAGRNLGHALGHPALCDPP